MKRVLALLSVLAVSSLALVAFLSSSGLRQAGTADRTGLTARRLDEAATLVREAYAALAPEDAASRRSLEAASGTLDEARALAAGMEFARARLALGLSAMILLIAIASAVFLAALWLFVLRGLARPVERLAAAMAVDPEAAVPVAAPRGSVRELRSLYAAYGAMVERLGEYRDRVRAAERETFGRFLVHELRNALAPLRLTVGLLEAPCRDAAAASGARSQLAAIDDLIERFRQAYRFPEPLKARCDIAELLRSLPCLRDDRVTVDLAAGASLEALADARLLGQAIANLAVNALEACEGLDGARVTVRASAEGDAVLVELIDTGAGMGREIAARLFTEWFSTKAKGTGLGLTLARRVVESHGGSLTFETEEGSGTTFSMRIPKGGEP